MTVCPCPCWKLVKQLSEQTGCSRVVDVGSGQVPLSTTRRPPPPSASPLSSSSSQQGHLTRFLSFGLGLSVTAIEADRALVAMATKFDAQLMCALEKEKQKTVRLSASPVESAASDTNQAAQVESSCTNAHLRRFCVFVAFLLLGGSSAVVSTPRGCLDQPQSIMGGLSCAAGSCWRAAVSTNSNRAQPEETARTGRRAPPARRPPGEAGGGGHTLPVCPGGKQPAGVSRLHPDWSPRLRRPQRHPPPPLCQLPTGLRHHLCGMLLHENHHQREPQPPRTGAMSRGAGPEPGAAALGVWLPHELLGAGPTGAPAVL